MLRRLDYHLGDKVFKDAVNDNPELLVQLGKRKDLRDPPETYLSLIISLNLMMGR